MLLSETVIVNQVAKRSHTAEIRTPIYRFRTLLSQPNCLHFFFNEKLRQFWTEQKKKNNPAEWILFRAYYESGGKKVIFKIKQQTWRYLHQKMILAITKKIP